MKSSDCNSDNNEPSTEAMLKQFMPAPATNAHELFYRAGWEAALSQQVTAVKPPQLRFTSGLLAGLAASFVATWLLGNLSSSRSSGDSVIATSAPITRQSIKSASTMKLESIPSPERDTPTQRTVAQTTWSFADLWINTTNNASISIGKTEIDDEDSIDQSIAEFENRPLRGKQHRTSFTQKELFADRFNPSPDETTSPDSTNEFRNRTIRSSVVREQLLRELN